LRGKETSDADMQAYGEDDGDRQARAIVRVYYDG
jgi:hypothetical protein